MLAFLLVLCAGAEELVEPGVALTEPVTSGSRTFTSGQPMYLLPTSTFDRLLQSELKLSACTQGLDEVKASSLDFEQRMSATLDEGKSALGVCSGQLLELQTQVTRARQQRNVAVGVATGLLVSGVVGAAIAL